MNKIGFIGCGNMGKAMIAGILDAGIVSADSIMASCLTPSKLEKIQNTYGILTTCRNKEVAAFADLIFLAVKPQYYETVIAEIKDELTEDKILVSIAPGRKLAWFEENAGETCKIIRTMPNTPSMVKEGMMGICVNSKVTEQELEQFQRICNSFSKTEVVPEHLMDVVTAVSGSSPAYVYIFIEAMADAAVEGGMPRSQAYTFAAQAVLGSAKMVLETGIHPGQLKDNVCSPGGTTIQAVRVLEEKGMRAAVMDAMRACLDKSKNM